MGGGGLNGGGSPPSLGSISPMKCNTRTTTVIHRTRVEINTQIPGFIEKQRKLFSQIRLNLHRLTLIMRKYLFLRSGVKFEATPTPSSPPLPFLVQPQAQLA